MAHKTRRDILLAAATVATVTTFTSPLLSAETAVSTPTGHRENWRDLNIFTYLDESRLDTTGMRRNGPLAGWTLAVKDNIEVAGMPCTCATPSLRHYVPKTTALAVTRLMEAGAVVVGKANMHELAYGITSINPTFGSVGNAYAHSHFAGGSSGGTAVAIATGLVRAGLGSDTGGSARIPAALNNIVGFRPSPDRYPASGLIRISPTRDVIGPMGRTVQDVALLDAILAAESCSPVLLADIKGLRLGLPRAHYQEQLSDDVATALFEAIERLRAAGAHVIVADLPNVAALNAAVSMPIVLYETRMALSDFLARSGLAISLKDLHAEIASADVKEIIGHVIDDPVPETAYRDALEVQRPKLQAIYREYFSHYGVAAILSATTPLPAGPIVGSEYFVKSQGKAVPTFTTFIQNTDPASNAGVPAISVPMGFCSPHSGTARLPIGLQLEGPFHMDRPLLSVAASVEAVFATHTI